MLVWWLVRRCNTQSINNPSSCSAGKVIIYGHVHHINVLDSHMWKDMLVLSMLQTKKTDLETVCLCFAFGVQSQIDLEIVNTRSWNIIIISEICTHISNGACPHCLQMALTCFSVYASSSSCVHTVFFKDLHHPIRKVIFMTVVIETPSCRLYLCWVWYLMWMSVSTQSRLNEWALHNLKICIDNGPKFEYFKSNQLVIHSLPEYASCLLMSSPIEQIPLYWIPQITHTLTNTST